MEFLLTSLLKMLDILIRDGRLLLNLRRQPVTDDDGGQCQTLLVALEPALYLL